MRGWKVWIEPSGKIHRCRWSGIYGTGQKTFTYKADAQELAKAKRQDFQRMAAGLPPALRIADAVTVEAYAKTYLSNSKREKGPRTYNNFDRPAVTSFAAQYGRLAIAAITDEHIRDWKCAVEKEYNGTTASMRFAVVRTFLNAAVKAGLIAKSPARHVSKPSEEPGGRALADWEISALLDEAPEPLFRSGTFALNTMLRISEVCLFDWSWVREIKGGGWMGKIPAYLRKTRGKISQDCIFPINTAARAVMGQRRESGRVFPYPHITIQQQLSKIRTTKNLPEDITFHCFRHSGASRYLKAGGHMEDLLKARLWSDPRSLLRYVHVEDQTLFERFSQIALPDQPPKQENRRPD